MKRGFTLVELLAVIVIIAVISLITTVAVGTIISDSKTDLSDVQKRKLEEAAQSYYLKEGMDINDTCVGISDLINKGYIEKDFVKNPETNENFEGSIKITYVSGKYSYEYQEQVCSDVCALKDIDGDKTIDTGEVISCSNGDIREEFYVVDSSNGNVNMLSKYNLTLSATSPLQDTSGANNSIVFSTSSYWYGDSGYTVDVDYASHGRRYPYIYNSSSNVYPYVEAYRDVLEGIGVNVIDAKLLSMEQAVSLGCPGFLQACSTQNKWVYSTTYWMGSGSSSFVMNMFKDGLSDVDIPSYMGGGIRPVIIIPTKSVKIPACYYTTDSSGNEMITCGTESFYIVEETSSTVTALSAYNITLSTTSPKQDTTDTTYPAKNSIEFSSSEYWVSNGQYTVDVNYASEGRSYPYVYNSSSSTYQYIEAYRDVLEGKGVNVQDAKLLSYEQAVALGCTNYSCDSAPEWVSRYDYWVGSSYYSSVQHMMWYIGTSVENYSGIVVTNRYFSNNPTYVSHGVRPLITFDKSDIG